MPFARLSLSCAAALLLTADLSAGAQRSAPVASARPPLVARLDSIATDFLTASPAAGMTIAVVSRGDTLLLAGYGERDRERHLAAEVNTVYRIASITKQFTAAAVMRLVERGTVKLEDPITTYLPQYPQWSSVTVRQLLGHTSGIKSYTSVPEWRSRWADDLTPAQLVAFVEKSAFDFPPGSNWQYNNTGYMLLGMLLETVTKQPYATLVAREFFTPLGMRSARYCPSRPTGTAYAVGYDEEAGKYRPTEYLSMTHPYAAGGLCMSVPVEARRPATAWASAEATSGRTRRSSMVGRSTASARSSTGSPRTRSASSRSSTRAAPNRTGSWKTWRRRCSGCRCGRRARPPRRSR
jgi:D-alanyl-D-alanine carboxypeptidase